MGLRIGMGYRYISRRDRRPRRSSHIDNDFIKTCILLRTAEDGGPYKLKFVISTSLSKVIFPFIGVLGRFKGDFLQKVPLVISYYSVHLSTVFLNSAISASASVTVGA